MPAKPRARDLGLPFPGQTGPCNAITDVAGVDVGMTTLRDPDRGICTGVTAILPRGAAATPDPVRAGQATLNGNGEMTGTHWIHDAGYLIGPVCITNTHSVGIVHHAATRWMVETYADWFAHQHGWAMPVVAETYDGMLNDINALHVTEAHALQALRSAAPGPVAEGPVGGGTGMVCYEFKGGTGTASRLVRLGAETYTLGVLVQANHGIRPWLTVLGRPVGSHLTEDRLLERETGSIIVIVATDAPLSDRNLERLARRALFGIMRTGSPATNGSGDYAVAFSTAESVRRTPERRRSAAEILDLPNSRISPLFQASVEATEEAVYNALFAAESMTGHRGRIEELPVDSVAAIMRRYGRAVKNEWD